MLLSCNLSYALISSKFSKFDSTIFVELCLKKSTNIVGMAKSPPKSLFGKRLREARVRAGIAQDKLGVMIGLDEGCSSARISRYESGVHSPPFALSERIASELKLPVAYFYCKDDRLAEIIRRYYIASEDIQTTIFDFTVKQTALTQ